MVCHVCNGRCGIVGTREERHGVEAGGGLAEFTQHELQLFVVWTVVLHHPGPLETDT